MDKAARAAQLAGCIAHTGDAFTFTAPGTATAVPFKANLQEEPLPGDADKNRLAPQPARQVRITAARAVFGARPPAVGEEIVGDTGHRYRIAALPEPATHATISFVCNAPASRA